MSNPNPRVEYLPTLDGWRAIAIAAVIVSHARATLAEMGVHGKVLAYALYGRLGVDLFFAISGFLICSRLLGEERLAGRISLSGFYVRRTFRILPLYFAYLATLSALAVTASLPVTAGELWACVLFYKNYDSSEGTFTNHFWSLCVEEHFYLLWPFFLLAAGARRAYWITPAVAFLVHCWRSLDSRLHVFARAFPDAGLMWRTDTRIDSLLWGCFAALVYFRHDRLRFPVWSQWALPAALVGAIAFSAPALPLLYATLFPLLILSTVTRPGTLLGRFLELPPLRWVGRLSYSLYVWQTLFLQAPSGPIPDWLLRLQRWPINLCMIVLCGVLSHYLLERPMVRVGRLLAKSPARAAGSGAGSTPGPGADRRAG